MADSSRRDTPMRWYVRLMLVVASVGFARGYCTIRAPYINLQAYARGQERMPFQGRDLMRWPMLLASHSAFLQRVTAGRVLLRSPEFLVMEVAAAVGMLLAGWSAVRLYRLAAPDGPMPELPFALLIVISLFNFVLNTPFSFPYDLPAMAFLGWGTYFAVQRRFWALLPVFVFGTWNRETTLFLIGVLLVVAATRGGELRLSNLRRRNWAEAVGLAVIWVLIKEWQHHHYAGNPSEAGSRLAGNLHNLMNPIFWPNVLSASAFLLPYVYFRRGAIEYAPVRACLLLLPFWVLLLLSVGQILESRIFGDISVLVAVATALIVLKTMRGEPAAAALRTTER